jgi:hypothetical protein
MPTRADTPTGVVLMDLKTKARFGIEGGSVRAAAAAVKSRGGEPSRSARAHPL